MRKGGGRTVNGAGYVLLYAPDHPSADARGYVRAHRLVMERMIGRYLNPGEHVHHVNARREDNCPSNLWLFPTNAAHRAWHVMAEKGHKLRVPMPPVQLGPAFDRLRPSVARSLRASHPSPQSQELREAA